MSDAPTPPSTSSTPPPQPRQMKKINQPFTVHQKHKAKLAQQAKDGSNKQRGPSVLASVLKWTFFALVTSAAASRAMTQSWTFGYEGKWSNPRQIYRALYPSAPLLMSEHQLSLHDGTNPNYPLYIAIDSEVYDVSDGGMRNYGPGGAYGAFAGKDAARAYVTGCFQTHLTHDLRGFTEKDMATLAHWKKFYTNHAKYHRVGTVVHPPIDPSTPLPAPCNGGKDQPGEKATKKGGQ